VGGWGAGSLPPSHYLKLGPAVRCRSSPEFPFRFIWLVAKGRFYFINIYSHGVAGWERTGRDAKVRLLGGKSKNKQKKAVRGLEKAIPRARLARNASRARQLRLCCERTFFIKIHTPGWGTGKEASGLREAGGERGGQEPG
jgi:hypothetical protein